MPDQPTRHHAHRGAALETLWEAHRPKHQATGRLPGASRGGPTPPDLRRYGDHLAIPLRPDRPTVVVNFVESLDGVVTVDPEHGTGAEISGYSEPDRFVMGLLRALADVVVIGAGTLRSAPSHTWTPRRANPAYGDAYEAWRRQLGLAAVPTTIIVTSRGDPPVHHPTLRTRDVPVIVVAPAAVAEQLRTTLPAWVRVEAAPGDGDVSATSILEVAARERAGVVLSEGGPHLTGTFVKEGLLDDLFLTLAPQLLGRPGSNRPDERYSFVEGIAFDPENAPWARLTSVRRSVDHLFLRYRFGEKAPAETPP